MTSSIAGSIEHRATYLSEFGNKWVTTAYILTFFKLFFLPFSIYQLIHHSPYLIFTISCLIALDIMDGKVLSFSKVPISYHIKIHRQLCDAGIDRILMHSLLLVAVFHFNLSLSYYFIFFSRELLLGYVVVYHHTASGKYLKPIWPSKVVNIALGLMIATATTLHAFHYSFLVFIIISSAYSLFLYRYYPKFIE